MSHNSREVNTLSTTANLLVRRKITSLSVELISLKDHHRDQLMLIWEREHKDVKSAIIHNLFYASRRDAEMSDTLPQRFCVGFDDAANEMLIVSIVNIINLFGHDLIHPIYKFKMLEGDKKVLNLLDISSSSKESGKYVKICLIRGGAQKTTECFKDMSYIRNSGEESDVLAALATWCPKLFETDMLNSYLNEPNVFNGYLLGKSLAEKNFSVSSEMMRRHHDQVTRMKLRMRLFPKTLAPLLRSSEILDFFKDTLNFGDYENLAPHSDLFCKLVWEKFICTETASFEGRPVFSDAQSCIFLRKAIRSFPWLCWDLLNFEASKWITDVFEDVLAGISEEAHGPDMHKCMQTCLKLIHLRPSQLPHVALKLFAGFQLQKDPVAVVKSLQSPSSQKNVRLYAKYVGDAAQLTLISLEAVPQAAVNEGWQEWFRDVVMAQPVASFQMLARLGRQSPETWKRLLDVLTESFETSDGVDPPDFRSNKALVLAVVEHSPHIFEHVDESLKHDSDALRAYLVGSHTANASSSVSLPGHLHQYSFKTLRELHEKVSAGPHEELKEHTANLHHQKLDQIKAAAIRLPLKISQKLLGADRFKRIVSSDRFDRFEKWLHGPSRLRPTR
jgi:hypothetical protein